MASPDRRCHSATRADPGSDSTATLQQSLLTKGRDHFEACTLIDHVSRTPVALRRIEQRLKAGDHAAALRAVDLQLRAGINNPALWLLKAQILETVQGPLAAEQVLQDAATRHPGEAGVQIALGDLCTRQFVADKALAAYEAALALKPASIEIARKILNFRPIAPSDPLVATLLAQALSAKRSTEVQARSLFLLGQIFVEAGLDATGFELYRAANDRVADQHRPPHREYRVPETVAAMRRSLFQTQDAHAGTTASCPAIIVAGLPRSGKSLIEQLLVQSPAIVSGGELAQARKLASDLESRSDTPATLAQTARPEQLRLLKAYDAALEKSYRPGARHVVDTSPANLPALGYLAMLQPEVPIVLCTRRAADLGTAIYFKKFRKGHRYSYELATLGRAIARAEYLVAHWQAILPNPIMQVAYEDLVEDPVGTQSTLFAFLGVDKPPPSTTNPGPTPGGAPGWRVYPSRSIDTASGITRSLIGFADRFAMQLAPLLDAYDEERHHRTA